MRRPVPIATAVIVVLLVLGAPFLGVHFADPDARVLPTSASTRAAADAIAANFRSGETNAFAVVAAQGQQPDRHLRLRRPRLDAWPEWPGSTPSPAPTPTARRVAAPTPALSARFANPTGTWLSVVPVATLQPQSPAGEHLVNHIRAVPAPWPVLVDGASAQLIDANAAIFAKVPLALGIIALVTFITLFLMFGSVLGAAQGARPQRLEPHRHVRRHGLGVPTRPRCRPAATSPPPAPSTRPCRSSCSASPSGCPWTTRCSSSPGSRRSTTTGRPPPPPWPDGLERTGRIVTSAAALLAVVFLSFATSSVSFIKLFGIGLTLAVLMDATLIRGILVPAFMRLAGNANWWAPKPLRAIYDRIGISESGDPVVVRDLEPVPAA